MRLTETKMMRGTRTRGSIRVTNGILAISIRAWKVVVAMAERSYSTWYRTNRRMRSMLVPLRAFPIGPVQMNTEVRTRTTIAPVRMSLMAA